MLGHPIFPDIDVKDEEAREKVEGRLRRKEWPKEEYVCRAISLKCWEQQYESTEEVVRELEAIEREHGGTRALGVGELAGEGKNIIADGSEYARLTLRVVWNRLGAAQGSVD